MDNWLLIIVGTIFLICIAFGYVRGFLNSDFPFCQQY